tara:strand:- start:4112 stop:4381 length:270 start_codon:yes stop_codon:yes gene_type:complete
MLSKVTFHEMVHNSRVKWITLLPKFKHILDIGGSSANISEGALIELGYLFRPKSLLIFDLPVNEQYWGLPKYSQNIDYQFHWGTLSYLH